MVREGLASLIGTEPGLKICGETGSAEEARRHLSETPPDLVILDLSLDEGSGLSLIEHLHGTQPDLPVLVVSMYDELLYARRALDNGADGYLMKNRADAQVVDAIRRVLGGNVYLSPELTSAIVSSAGGGDSTSGTSSHGMLTDRELEVLTLVGRGLQRRDIAEMLALSPKTVDTHRRHLQEKLSLKSSAGLQRYAAVWEASAERPVE